jgi:hypothetical protein
MPTTSTPTTRAPTDKPTTHTPTSGERFLKILFSHDLKIFFVLDFYITGKNPKKHCNILDRIWNVPQQNAKRNTEKGRSWEHGKLLKD